MKSKAESQYDFPEGAQAKIHINLPSIAWEILTLDIQEFTENKLTNGMSNYVSQLVVNYISNLRHPVDVEKVIKRKSDSILSKLSGKLDVHAEKQLKHAVEAAAIEEILQEYTVPKDEYRKIDLNKAAKEELEAFGRFNNKKPPLIAQVFDTSSALVRAILLDYCRQSSTERCHIFKQECVDRINYAIKNHYSIEINAKTGALSQSVIIPYGIISDSYHIHSYLVGLYADKRNPDDIFLMNMSKINTVSNAAAKCQLTKEEKNAIKAKIKQLGVGYLRARHDNYTVYLSPKGEKELKKNSYMRPVQLPSTDEEKSKHIYHFAGANYQITNYFRRFGKDAVILEPQSTHDNMLEEYKQAVEAYEK